ncbi:TRIM2_3 [Mytilus edulis]|uniref:TRIM2_3 n=1 Tax=Mytilus edulis TaxID=6550 RepID=A0A8S3UUH9_MYTED|nr:TRIM2_3 [Mytilus edulis]
MAVNADGEVVYTIPLKELYSAFDVASLDDLTIAVSTGYSAIENKPGVNYSITTIPNTGSPLYLCVSTHADKIFFTNPDKHTVSCCLYSGKLVWEFKDKSVLKNPRGITIDNKGNVFVVGKDSCNVVVISPDGNQCIQILYKEDGIDGLTAIAIGKGGISY